MVRRAGASPPVPAPEPQVWAALVTGVRDYLGKNGFPGALIGLSGGIDSALVLAVAVDALGADKVRTVMMPSPYTADISWIDARDMAARLGVRYDEIAIEPMFDAFNAAAWPLCSKAGRKTPPKRTCRRASAARLLMALSNKLGCHRADHRQQERDGHRLLHAVPATWRAASPSSRTSAKTLVYRLCALEESRRARQP